MEDREHLLRQVQAGLEDALFLARVRTRIGLEGKGHLSLIMMHANTLMRNDVTQADVAWLVRSLRVNRLLGTWVAEGDEFLSARELVRQWEKRLEQVKEPAVPQGKPTGEVVVMRVPDYDEGAPGRRVHWLALAEAVAKAGATLRVLPPPVREVIEREPMFTRDPFVKGVRGFYDTEQTQPHIEDERDLLAGLGGVQPRARLDGFLEGGTLVVHRPAGPAQPVLFVGVAHPAAMQLKQFMFGAGEYCLHQVHAIKHEVAQQVLAACNSLSKLEQVRVVPLSIKDTHAKTFYHLDGALGALPTGQVVVCLEVFNRASQERIKKEVGEENLIRISQEEAMMGATNFITVGSNIITPYASSRLKQQLHGLGYTVIDPTAANLMPGDWMFGEMASVRCATLKVTEDMGFPNQQETGKGCARG